MSGINETKLVPAGSGGAQTFPAKSVPQPAKTVAVTFTVESAGPASAPAGPSATAATTGGTQAIATYFYEIAAVNSAGLESAVSTEVHSTITTSTGSTTLSWSTVSGSTAYHVYVNSTTSGAEARYYTTTSASLTDDGSLGTGTTATPSTVAPTVTFKVQGGFDGTNFYDLPYVTEATATESQATATMTTAGQKVRYLALAPTRFFPLYRLVTTTTTASQLTYNAALYSYGD